MRRVAGIGFRKGAGVDSLQAALDSAGASGLTHLATVRGKDDAVCLRSLGQRLGLPVVAVDTADLAGIEVATVSEKSFAIYGTHSVSEAAALVVAGPGAVLRTQRVISGDSMATCAIAEAREDGEQA